jgi:hypothetical protein
MTQSTQVSFAARLLERLNLRFPTLFIVFAILTLIDFVIPDSIPFFDEIGLALLTLLFGMWKNRKAVNNQRGAP